MIDLLTRSAYPELYTEMVKSAKATAKGRVNFISTPDDGQPRMVESYTLLASMSSAEILLFVHDDIKFLSAGWDEKIKDAFDLGFNLVGVVGSKQYRGGMIFDAGYKYSAGKISGRQDGKSIVKLMAHRTEIEPVKVVDGCFIAVSRKHLLANPLDPQFDGLFLWDLDLCLRSNCAVVDILVAHEKPDHMKGTYPKDLRPMSDFEPAFYTKHGLGQVQIGDQRCDAVPLEDYLAVPA